MFNLHQLGWVGFQELSLTVAREIFGQTVRSFLETADAGKDGAFTGIWTTTEGQSYTGEFVFQCKFSNKANKTIRLCDLKDEFAKIDRLVQSHRCDIYILMTNMGVTGAMEEKINQEVLSRGVKTCLIFNYKWFDQVIRDNTRLRVMVPRVYGLGDLSQILDERGYKQGKLLLEHLKDDMAKIVVTQAYRDAAKALKEHGFVLLIGDPAAGKTTIASLLAMGAMDEWKVRVMKLSTVEQVIKHWNPEDPNALFWVDDAFGVTQYELTLALEWNRRFLELATLLKQGVKLVLTSRNYIYHSARKDLKEGAFPLLNESQIVIDVRNLLAQERKQILYNHLKMGKQPDAFLKDIKRHLEDLAALPAFNPESARRLSDPLFTKGLYMQKWYLEHFINKQEAFLVNLIKELDKHSRAALALIYMGSDKLSSPVDFSVFPRWAIEKLGSTASQAIEALEAMNGNLVQLLHLEGESIWKFRHPTIGDAFTIFIRDTAELLDIYLDGATADTLMQQVTCGDMAIAKAIIIPSRFYPIILSKLNGFTSSSRYKEKYLAVWGAKRDLCTFLATRCSDVFLRQYITHKPGIVDEVSELNSTDEYSPELRLAHRLLSAGFFTESHRQTVVAKLISAVMRGEDFYILSNTSLREFFTDEEYLAFKHRVDTELIDHLSDIRLRQIREFPNRILPSEDADDFIRPLLNNFDELVDLYEWGSESHNKIHMEIEAIKDWIKENKGKVRQVPERESLTGEVLLTGGEGNRSIFDDVDL